YILGAEPSGKICFCRHRYLYGDIKCKASTGCFPRWGMEFACSLGALERHETRGREVRVGLSKRNSVFEVIGRHRQFDVGVAAKQMALGVSALTFALKADH